MKTYSITVKGKEHRWAFNFVGGDHLEEWRDDGLEVNEISAPSRMARFWHWIRSLTGTRNLLRAT